MGKLTELLKLNPIDEGYTEEVFYTTRFKDDDGNPLKATVKPMSSKQMMNYKKLHTKYGSKGIPETDQGKVLEKIIINHSVEPNFRDAENIKAMGVNTPEELLYKWLNAGEVVALAQGIQEVSGLDGAIDDLKEQLKN